MRLRNKVALVTGGGSGIGRATCELFAREGAVLAVLDLDPRAAEATANSVRGKGQAIALNADVSDSTVLRKAIDVVIARFGRIDILVNNAGYGIREALEETEAHGIRLKAPKSRAGRRDVGLPEIVVDTLRNHRR